MYIHENHMGGLYASYEFLGYDELYCEQCGDSDILIGYAETKEDAYNLLKNDIDVFDEDVYDMDYVERFVESLYS